MLWAAKRKKTAPLIHNNLLLKPFGILWLAAAKQRLNNKNAEPLALLLSSDGQPSEQVQLQAKCLAVIQSRHRSSLRLLCQLHCQCWHRALLGCLLHPRGAAADGEQGSLPRSLHGAKAGAVLGLRTAGRLRWRAGHVKPLLVCFFKGLQEWAKSEILVGAAFVS